MKVKRRQGTFVYQNAHPRPPLLADCLAEPCTRSAISTTHSLLLTVLVEKTAPFESGMGGEMRKKSGEVGNRVL